MLRFITFPFSLLFISIDKIFDLIFGKSETKVPNEFKFDISDWVKKKPKNKGGKAKISELDGERIEFTYKTHSDFLKEISEGMKIINIRTTLLIGYLSTIVATLAPLLLVKDFFGEFTPYIWDILLAYLILIVFMANRLINTTLPNLTYDEPLDIKYKEVTEVNINLLKLIVIHLLENKIKVNIDKLKKLTRYLKNSISAVFIIPIISIILYLFGVDPLNNIIG